MTDVDKELIEAAKNGDLRGAQRAIDDGADVNVQDEYGLTALMQASNYGKGYTEIVKLLLDHGADVNMTSNGDTALMFASTNDHTEIVRILLDHGADINVQDKYGQTALMQASGEECGHTEIVKLLLDHGADINVQDEYGQTALMNAIEFEYTEIVKLLLEHGADPNLQNKYGSTTLEWASEDTEIIKLLLDHGADPFIRNNKGEFPEIPNKVLAEWMLQHPIIAPNKALTEVREAADTDYMKTVRLMKQNVRLEKKWKEEVRLRETVVRSLEKELAHAKRKLQATVQAHERISTELSRLIKIVKSSAGGHVVGGSQIYLPPGVQKKITSYLFQDLKSLTVSQLRRVYQKVYGKKCPAKTKREILYLLHRK